MRHHHHHHVRNPICCIIPPHMVETLAMRGDKKIRAMAHSLLEQNKQVREERAEMPLAPAALAAALPPPATTRNLRRAIHNGGKKTTLPGKLVRSEGQPPTGDKNVDEAYDGAGEVYDLYFKEFGRDSLDNGGLKLVSTVHHRRGYNNAFWNGLQMVYGDGDGRIFRTFTELSVIGHEMSHGVVQFSGGLVYQGESGALNESFADVFGALTVQRKAGESASQADWLIGKGILGPTIKGTALRNMKAPGTAYDDALLGKDPQPYHMDFFVRTTGDNGGVHINSGIPNHAFYLYSQLVGGNAWDKPGKVWYDAMQVINNSTATFNDWAQQTMESAIKLFGLGAIETLYLRRAWKLVGISV
ncbi:MAG: M4 family metallopeptidase [Propylenella sp.]